MENGTVMEHSTRRCTVCGSAVERAASSCVTCGADLAASRPSGTRPPEDATRRIGSYNAPRDNAPRAVPMQWPESRAAEATTRWSSDLDAAGTDAAPPGSDRTEQKDAARPSQSSLPLPVDLPAPTTIQVTPAGLPMRTPLPSDATDSELLAAFSRSWQPSTILPTPPGTATEPAASPPAVQPPAADEPRPAPPYAPDPAPPVDTPSAPVPEQLVMPGPPPTSPPPAGGSVHVPVVGVPVPPPAPTTALVPPAPVRTPRAVPPVAAPRVPTQAMPVLPTATTPAGPKPIATPGLYQSGAYAQVTQTAPTVPTAGAAPRWSRPTGTVYGGHSGLPTSSNAESPINVSGSLTGLILSRGTSPDHRAAIRKKERRARRRAVLAVVLGTLVFFSAIAAVVMILAGDFIRSLINTLTG